MTSVVRWVAGLIVIAILVACLVAIVASGIDRNWGGVVVGLVGFGVLVGAFVTIDRSAH